MLQIAHLLLHQGKAAIYGGFLRDLVVRGEAPKDIDTRADSPAHLATLVPLLKDFAAQNLESISLQSCEVTATNLTRLTFRGQEWTFMVEITDPVHFPDEPTDLTSSDLRFCREKGLYKKTKQEDKFPLSVLQQSIREKRFSVLNVQKLNDPQHGHLVRKAIAKMTARGWTLEES